MEKLLLSQKCMSFGNSTTVGKIATLAIVATVLVGGLLVSSQLKAASNCGSGPSYDSVSKTLSLVCTESTDIHELSCSDPTNPDTLSLSVNGSNETITCPPDLPPNTVPSLSISGPASGDYGVSYTFTITGTDAERDTLTYYIDWNNDGTADYVSGVLASGAGQAAAYSWAVVGAQTFQAQAIDSKGGASPWTAHTITIGNPPAATASLELQVNGGSWGDANQTVNPGDTVTVRWSSNNASTCTSSGSGFDTANNTSGSDGVTTPAPNSATTFTVDCSGPGGSGSDSITVTSRQSPNFTTPLINQSASAGFDPATGMYNSVTITFQTTNNGGSDTTASANYRLEFDRYKDGYELTTNGSLGQLNVGQSVNRSEVITNVPFGNSRVKVIVDSDDDVAEVNEGDNESELELDLLPPNPNISINADRRLVKSGEPVTLTWDTNVTYPMACRVYGPGITTYSFNPSTDGRTSGSPLTSAPLKAKSEYTLSCAVGGTTFTDSVVVEVQGVIEEI
jgi:CARDB